MELQALQEMAAQRWQDVQHERRQEANSAAEAHSEIQVQVGEVGAARFLEGTWQQQGDRKGSPVWRHTERCLHMYLSPSGRWVMGREVGSSKGAAVSQACSADLGQLGQQSEWQIYDGKGWARQVVKMWGDHGVGLCSLDPPFPPSEYKMGDQSAGRGNKWRGEHGRLGRQG